LTIGDVTGETSSLQTGSTGKPLTEHSLIIAARAAPAESSFGDVDPPKIVGKPFGGAFGDAGQDCFAAARACDEGKPCP
jgi:hypothetical protein